MSAFTVWGWELAEPRVLAVLVVIPLLAWAASRSLAELPRPLRILSAALRLAFVGVLVLALAQSQVSESSTRICSTVLLDVSDSLSDEALESGRRRVIEISRAKREGDSLRLLVFADDVRSLPVPSAPDYRLPSVTELRKRVRQGESDLERALRSAGAVAGQDCLERTLLLSDGIQTRGDAGSAWSGQPEASRLSTGLLRGPERIDAAVLDVRVPDDVQLGAPFEISVELSSSAPLAVRLRLLRGETGEQQEAEKELTLGAGPTRVALDSVVREPGPTSYRVRLEPRGADEFAENNEQRVRFVVPGPPRILVVDAEPGQARYLADALVAQQFDVDLRSPAAFPQSRGEIEQFRFVVLSDVPRAQLSRGAEQLLISYVKSGGGLLYAGGAGGYGPGGWQGSELARVLPVSMDDEKSRETPGVALALVIDRSGSMTGLPLELAKEACAATLGVLDAHDLLEVIAFDAQPTRYAKMQPARYKSRIEQEIRRIQPGGGTEIFPALDAAFQDLLGTEARRKHVILLTDGNAGAEGLFDLVANAFADGVGVTSVGLGAGVNEELLRSVAEAGGGRYHHAPDPNSLPRIFTRETELLTQEEEVSDWYPLRGTGAGAFAKGVDFAQAPYLRGFTKVSLKPAPAEAIVTTESGEPVLARQRVGLGFTLAWTSDFKAHWALDLLRWKQLGKFLGQMVREHQRSNDELELPMTEQLVGDELLVRVDAYDSNERFDNGLVSTLHLESVAGEQRQLPFQLVAPGRYEARARLPALGSYALRAEHRRRDPSGALVPFASSRGSVVRSYPDEFRRWQPDESLLASLAKNGRGQVDPTPARFWDPGQDRLTHKVSRTLPLLGLALLLFVLDLMARRLRLPERSERS